LPGGVSIQLATFFGAERWPDRAGGGLAQLRGVAAQRAQASPVTAGAEFLVQPVGVAAALFPPLAQVGRCGSRTLTRAAGASAGSSPGSAASA